MLRRFLRSLGGQEAASVPPSSYVDDVLSTCAPYVDEAVAATADGDPLHLLGDLFVRSESAREWDSIGLEGAQREQFLRTYAGMLLENDRLPPALQLTPDELKMPRRLLDAFFGGSNSVQREAQAVLNFIEERFSSSRFGQARLLLQLFDTDATTRRNNERNLFYEEMILRFMSKRTGSIGAERESDFQRVAAETMTARGEGIRDLAAWLSHHVGVRLHLFGRAWADDSSWKSALEGMPDATKNAMRITVPTWRWRPVASTQGSIADALATHVDERGLEPYLVGLTRSAYFVTLAPGATGYEEFLFRYVTWLDEHFSCSAIRVLPDLHRQTTIDEVGLPDALESIHEKYLSESSFGSGVFSQEAIGEALGRLQRALQAFDPTSIPEGDYNLGGLVFDLLVEFPYEDISQAFRVHRLT